ncbi:KRI1-like family C-terminal-domain-containing protein [Melanogaster broomeanus]|nr:KRI1-like family C-terminal-domain-containing protein [Melanogaster broomeanus]
MLSDSDGEENNQNTLTINEHYAKAFQYKKEREELAQLKEKYGSDYAESGLSESDDSDDSEDTEEDSDGEELTPAVDAAILRTLARIRKKDPVIYEDGRNVYEEEHVRTQDRAPIVKSKTKDKSKPLTIREAALASALAESHSRSPSPELKHLTYTEEQRLLQSETHVVDDDGDDLLIPRSRTRDEIELEEEEYKAFLQREVGEDLRDLVAVEADVVSNDLEDARKSEEEHGSKKKKKGKMEREMETEMEGKREEEDGKRKNDRKKVDKKSKEEADQDFLMNYIFNRGWVDRSSHRVPTYNEIVDSSSKSSKRKLTMSRSDPGPDGEGAELLDSGEREILSDEDSFDDLADAFETSYNFRFEEPNAVLIASHSRLLPVSSTQEETPQAAAEEDLARLKALKAKELRRKLERVSTEGGLAGIDEEADGPDMEKPTWEDDIDIDDIVPSANTNSKAELKKKKKKEKKKEKKGRGDSGDQDEDIGVDVDEMDVDVDGGWDEGDDGGDWEGTEEERKRKVAAYMDEVVNRLGFSGITSHIPTRFHYTSTTPDNYGLTPAEILLATDADLNSYVGLKKIAPYRVDKGGKMRKNWDPMRTQHLKEFREKLRSRVGLSSDGVWSLDAGFKNRATEERGEKKKRKDNLRQKRKRDSYLQADRPDPSPGSAEGVDASQNGDAANGESKKKRRRRHKKGSGAGTVEVAPS